MLLKTDFLKINTLKTKQKARYNRTAWLLPLVTRLTVLSVLSTSALTAYAAGTIEEHSPSDVDPTAPILALDRLQSLQNVPPLEFNLPAIHHFNTTNGVPVSFVRTTQIPIVDVDLRFNAGSARDEEIREGGFGIANMTAGMLSQGTQSYDEDAFAATAEQLGIGLGADAYKDMFIISLRSLSDDDYLEPAVDLIEDMLAEPSFDATVLERNKAQLLLALQQQLQSPGSVASLAFAEALYGEHPYAHPSSGTLESVPTLNRDDLVAFWRKFLVANNATLAITGDLTLDEAQALANELTAVLPIGEKPDALPTPEPLTAGQRIDIPFDSTQTSVLIGQIGNARSSDPAQMQAQTSFGIGNDILAGGGFNARLMTEIRKNRGLTYGISGGMAPMQTNGPYVISFSTRRDKSEEAIDATLDIIKDTLETGVTPSELALTKESFINSYPMGFTSNSSINSTFGMMAFYNLPDSYLNDHIDRIEATDLNSVNTELRDTLKPDNFLIVTVGQHNVDETQ